MTDGPPQPGRARVPDESGEHDEAGIKDTIESILIAFILAFVFRGFVVEAFVIPTGSMAPTLLGAHMRFSCDDCGYEFDTNFDTGSSSEDVNIPSTAGPNTVQLVVCPNCGFHLPKAVPEDQAYDPLVRYGDRILVLKYLYLVQEPQRWDVVVFKSPMDRDKYDYTQNFIKRLIGRPGESVMILDGDVYVGERDAAAEQMVVQTKPRAVQNALWRIIHDEDYQPRGVKRKNAAAYVPPWTRRSGQNGWELPGPPEAGASGKQRAFTFDNLNGSAEIFFNDQVNVHDAGAANMLGRDSAFNDWLTYDSEAKPRPRPSDGWSLVGDLKLQFFYERQSGEGPLRLLLSKRGQGFVAEITRDSARLLSDDGRKSGELRELIGWTPIGRKTAPMQIEFTNVDYQVALHIDNVEIFHTTAQQYHPDMHDLLGGREKSNLHPEVRISAAQQRCELSHVSLWRDVYYLSRDPGHRSATLLNPMRLNANEYFVMGDNSQISGDGRYWSEPTVLPAEDLDVDAGKVPARFMLGKAFFVYWPAGFRPFGSKTLPALVPNFGDMRMIH